MGPVGVMLIATALESGSTVFKSDLSEMAGIVPSSGVALVEVTGRVGGAGSICVVRVGADSADCE